MPAWGPVSVSAGPGTVTPDAQRRTIFDTGTFAPGGVPHISGTTRTTFTGGRDDAAWSIGAQALAANGDQIEFVQLVQLRLSSPDASFNYNVPLGATRVVVSWAIALYQGQTAQNVSSGQSDTGTFCQYGTRLSTGGQATIILTQSFIETALLEVGLPWLAAAMTPLYGVVLDASGLCGQGPPQLPVVSSALFTASIETLLQVFKAVTWSNFCECVPGTPAPVPYPVPQPTQPTSWPITPTFPCDPADLCASIAAIRAQVNALSGTVAQVLDLTTLLQRYRLPFAYIPGATHSNLTSQGGFATSRLVGLRVEVIQRPDTTLVLRGNPPYLWDMGWLSVNDANGMLEQLRLTRDDQVWFPNEMAAALRFQWDLFDGVVMRVTELEAEP